tara:strand:+ start:667 stop:882 length:216 start_codon:yes stop_codon:yes gene_type:complete
VGRTLSVKVKNPPIKYDACVGLVKVGERGAVKEVWNTGKSKPIRWCYRYLPMRYISWDRDGAFIGRRRKVK